MEKEFRNMLEELKANSKNETGSEHEQQKQQIREFISSKRKTTFKERKTLAVNTIPQYQKGEIKIGGLVKLIAGTEVGRLESIQKNRATVVFRNLKTTIPLEELMGIAETEAPQINQPVLKVEIDQSEFNSELDLRGKSKEEALVELENYLDKAMMRNIFQVRILHGKGTGAIRELVQQTLKKLKGIKKYEFATREQGGDGVTLVEF
jgi:DNA mismatch repair protein MutS2